MSIDGVRDWWDEPATERRVAFCKSLFRKVKFHYQCLVDDDLVVAVKERTGFDLLNLTRGDAQRIIDELNKETQRQRVSHKQWGRRFGRG